MWMLEGDQFFSLRESFAHFGAPLTIGQSVWEASITSSMVNSKIFPHIQRLGLEPAGPLDPGGERDSPTVA